MLSVLTFISQINITFFILLLVVEILIFSLVTSRNVNFDDLYNRWGRWWGVIRRRENVSIRSDEIHVFLTLMPFAAQETIRHHRYRLRQIRRAMEIPPQFTTDRERISKSNFGIFTLAPLHLGDAGVHSALCRRTRMTQSVVSGLEVRTAHH